MNKEQYLAEGGVNCPYCSSPDITGDSFTADAGSAEQEIFCLDCLKSWIDVYTLTNVRENSDD